MFPLAGASELHKLDGSEFVCSPRGAATRLSSFGSVFARNGVGRAILFGAPGESDRVETLRGSVSADLAPS